MAKGTYPNKAAQKVAEFRSEVEVGPIKAEKRKVVVPRRGKCIKYRCQFL